jgi:hypothetical protein
MSDDVYLGLTSKPFLSAPAQHAADTSIAGNLKKRKRSESLSD